MNTAALHVLGPVACEEPGVSIVRQQASLAITGFV